MIWAKDFDNSKRHCWPLNDGTRTLEGHFDKKCLLDHSDNPKVIGKVEWLRFIHAYSGEFNPPEGSKIHFTHGLRTSDGRYAYAEEYPDTDGNLKFRVFLDNENGWARIECYKPEYFEMCDSAYESVVKSYE